MEVIQEGITNPLGIGFGCDCGCIQVVCPSVEVGCISIQVKCDPSS